MTENSSCIITVVKNEHLYLKEWIEYHLRLGVGHIFVFEDIDSDTHKDITNAFGDRVSLHGVFDVLNDSDRETAVSVKKSRKWNIQHLYLRNALRYVIDGFSDRYEWCFLIDADEFLTLENTADGLDGVLSLYKDYDAFVMLWKCYGADGHIHRPDYGDRGVVGTYTKPIDNRAVDKPCSLVKTCYRLSAYKPEFFHNQHRPTEACEWCNTDLRRNKKPSYSRIYIRHYVTKSWDEYVWKRKVRGFLWGRTRGFDMFFAVNADLAPLKKELLRKIIKK